MGKYVFDLVKGEKHFWEFLFIFGLEKKFKKDNPTSADS